MTEYEKMMAGELYYAGDPELRKIRSYARSLLDEMNKSVSEIKPGQRYELAEKLFGRMGENLFLQPPFYCDYGENIELGDNVFFNYGCVFLDVAKIRVGSNVLFAPNVQVYTASHPLDFSLRRDEQEFGKPITIGDDAWIGGGAIICPGVKVGKCSVVGAGAVVTKDVAPSTVAAGNPARVIKRI
ncbi:sugar O-acetyltransferase [Sedimentisphaera cyanobacteriorum]|nr:sugar O-acetyltransferase [Sedimentisphaera cyanobacteriorum]